MSLEKQLESLFNLSTNIRGRFLDQVIVIERLIDDIISRHFCPEDYRFHLLFSLVATELTFHSRIKTLKTVLECCYPELLGKHPNLIKDIKKIKEFRNKIAHSMLDSSEDFLEKEYDDRIRLEFYRKGEKKYLVVKKDDIMERLKACSQVVLALVDIQREVMQQVQTKKK